MPDSEKQAFSISLNKRQAEYLVDHYCNMFYSEDWNDSGSLADAELEELRQQLVTFSEMLQ